jgi:Holliday junction DNA helicase RuvA
VIGSLRGKVAGRTGNTLLVDVNGVGYMVHAALTTLQAAGDMGDDVFLWVHTIVREDAISLYGFHEPEDRELFLMLLGVQSVGPKAALSILSSRTAADILDAIASGNKVALCTADGIGPKIAARIITELQSKAVQAGGSAPSATSGAITLKGGRPGGAAGEDAWQALRGLGFERSECDQLITLVLSHASPPEDAPSIIAACLRAAHSRAA